MRIMAVDYGRKRVGIASTDESGRFALPRMVLSNNKDLIKEVVKMSEEDNIDTIVIGESMNLDGIPNPIHKDILEFKSLLEQKGLRVALHPEVYTSQEASRLQGESDMLDASAAALILKSYIDSHDNN